jgi:adenosylmethionine-8-amino-7-oxononanoate aminotransferase
VSQISDFEAQVLSELGARHGNALGSCSVCGDPVLLDENFMRVDGRVAHVNCPHLRPRPRGEEAGRALWRWRHDKGTDGRPRLPARAQRASV